MKVETVRAIENGVKSILPTVDSFIKIYDRLDLKALRICLSNISANTEHCVNHSLERDIKQIENVLELCEAMKQRTEFDPTLGFILEDVISTIEGLVMCEEFEDSF